jgi:uncharacterized protein (UPF0218 family)
MAFGNIGKALVGQALESTKKNVLDNLMAADAPRPAEKSHTPAAPPDPVGVVILNQIQGMQRALRDDQELVVSIDTGSDMLRVTDIFVPTLQVLVLAGEDDEKNVTRVVTAAESAKLVCKIVRVAPGAQAVRVNIRWPRPKEPVSQA